MGTHQQFFLLRPHQLPRSRSELVATPQVADALGLMRRADSPASEEEALRTAKEALCRLAMAEECFRPVAADPDESPDNRANDVIFHIVRVEGPVFPLLVHSTTQGFVALLEEAIDAGANLTPIEWCRLRAAFSVLFNFFRGDDPAEDIAPDTALRPGLPGAGRDGKHDALQRWTRGHHMFMVIIQGLVVLLNSSRYEIEASNLRAADMLLGELTRVMTAVGPALRFTGDFGYSDYERKIRPTLMPPAAPSGLSGLYWRDHEYLMRLLARMRPTLTKLDIPLRHHAQTLHDALADAYESHKAVCSSFVGTESSSLLLASRTGQPAVDILDHFKRVRLQLVKPP